MPHADMQLAPRVLCYYMHTVCQEQGSLLSAVSSAVLGSDVFRQLAPHLCLALCSPEYLQHSKKNQHLGFYKPCSLLLRQPNSKHISGHVVLWLQSVTRAIANMTCSACWHLKGIDSACPPMHADSVMHIHARTYT